MISDLPPIDRCFIITNTGNIQCSFPYSPTHLEFFPEQGRGIILIQQAILHNRLLAVCHPLRLPFTGRQGGTSPLRPGLGKSITNNKQYKKGKKEDSVQAYHHGKFIIGQE